MNKKMIVVDLDGTLLNIDKKISDKTKNYLTNLKKKGYLIVIATGRIFDSAISITNGAEFADYIISNSGGAIYDKKTNKILYKNIIDKKTVNKICDLYNDDINYIELCDLHYCYKYTNKDYEMHRFSKIIEDKDTFINNTEIINILIHSNDLDSMYNYLRNNFNDIRPYIMYDSFDDSDKWIVIDGLNVNKFNAIKMIALKENIENSNIIAFGDSNNDLNMIKNCGVGVAMSNAVENLKKEADYITGSHNDDGIVSFLEKYLAN